MTTETLPFNELPHSMQLSVAEQVSNYTNGLTGEKPQMLPATPQEIYNKHAGFIALSDGEFAGYIGATQPVVWNNTPMPEVGAFWVPKEFRGQGNGHKLVAAISQALKQAGELPYALANSVSEPIFTAQGYTAAQSHEVPTSAFDLCGNCPFKPALGCCDQPMVFTGASV
jgi:N-acetylglutamate synthase-like GNAT family acetyltransferase